MTRGHTRVIGAAAVVVLLVGAFTLYWRYQQEQDRRICQAFRDARAHSYSQPWVERVRAAGAGVHDRLGATARRATASGLPPSLVMSSEDHTVVGDTCAGLGLPTPT